MSNIRALWSAPVDPFSVDSGPLRNVSVHQPHDVYLRHTFQSPSHTSQLTYNRQPQDSQFTTTGFRRSSCDSGISSVSTHPESSIQSTNERQQLTNSQWHAGNATVLGHSIENADNQFHGYFNPIPGPETIQYAPWNVNARDKLRARTGGACDHLQGLDGTFSGSSATPTESEHSDRTFSTTSTNSSFADSLEDWRSQQSHMAESIDEAMTPIEQFYNITETIATYPQRTFAKWNECESCWPAYPMHDRVVNDFCGDYGPGFRTSRSAPLNFASPINNQAPGSSCPQDRSNYLPLWNDLCWNSERLAKPYFERQQSQPGSQVIKRTPQQAREAAEDEASPSTSVVKYDYEQRKPTNAVCEDISQPANNGLGMSKSISSAQIPVEKNCMLVCWRRAGLTYKEIKMRGNFREAESTLRGRYRALTKQKHERLRTPAWQDKDVELLGEVVNGFLGAADHMTKDRLPWKKVAELIVSRGGTYLFGPGTCKKKWEQLVMDGHAHATAGHNTPQVE